ncbi:carboxyl transferase domain-containing protein [Tritonibacter horizontis]|uniref:Methylmalonyl-CoA carboxyltransferase 12S subunit n=1 Tax=Tritonibacter horizontis TaxID=1768241 RepID=A0A132C1C5_9RHOB|nr:carboxyl transferase domain-containing protein [Tritonibacter horizontis]KUP94408.1 methylmalonyl-CoA carboxyltransferase 12S subunit [Tritonibacter horizontis]
MNAVYSRITPTDTGLSHNRAEMEALIARMRRLEARAAAKSAEKHQLYERRGQLSPRDRLAALLDPGLPFLELFNMISYLVDDPDPATSVPGASMIAGIGFVAGVRVMVCVDDAAIMGGARTRKTADKLLGLVTIAGRQKLPFLFLMDSIGTDPMRDGVESWARAGDCLGAFARLSAAGVPVVTVLHGVATAAEACLAGGADHVIAVRGRGQAMLAGAAAVQALTGEEVGGAALGGAQMHAEVTGLVDDLAASDADAVAIARRWVEGLHWQTCTGPRAPYAAPAYPPDDILNVVSADYRNPFDMTELALRLVDGGSLRRFKPEYGMALPCWQARIMGHDVGLLGNNGPLDPEGGRKACQFLQAMERADTPMIFLNNTTGTALGSRSERAGMIPQAARMIRAVATLSVPKIALLVGASFGVGNSGMGGQGAGADFLFSWPNARSGALASGHAALTMEQVARRTAARCGRGIDEARLGRQRDAVLRHFDRQSEAFFTSGQGLDMGMIDPRDSRRVIGICLDTCQEARARQLRAGGDRSVRA